MENLRFQTLLHHLGREVCYIGTKLNKEVHKCVVDLDNSHDTQKFCDKLAEILRKFSDYTVQYAKNLEDRITDAGNGPEYENAIKTLQQLILIRDVNCNNCRGREHNNETSTLEPNRGIPSDSGNESTSNAGLRHGSDAVLSQCSSLHIDNEIKPEQLTLSEENVVATDIISSQNESQSSTDGSSSTIIYDISNNELNNINATNDVDDAIANLLAISHSEEVDISEDGNIVDVPITENNVLNGNASSSFDDVFDEETVANSPPNLEDVDPVVTSSLQKEETIVREVDYGSDSVVQSLASQQDNLSDSDVEFVVEMPPKTSPTSVSYQKNIKNSPSSNEIPNVKENNVLADESVEATTSQYNISSSNCNSDKEISSNISCTSKADLATSPQLLVEKNIGVATSQGLSSDTNALEIPNNLVSLGSSIINDSALVKLKNNVKYSSIDESDDSDIEIVSSSTTSIQTDLTPKKLALNNPATLQHQNNTVAENNFVESHVEAPKQKTIDMVTADSKETVDADKLVDSDQETVMNSPLALPLRDDDEDATSVNYDSDVTVANLTLPRTDDTVMNEHLNRATLPDDTGEATDCSQVFSLENNELTQKAVREAPEGSESNGEQEQVGVVETTEKYLRSNNADSDAIFDLAQANVTQEPVDANIVDNKKRHTDIIHTDSDTELNVCAQANLVNKKISDPNLVKPAVESQENKESSHSKNDDSYSDIDFDGPTQPIAGHEQVQATVAMFTEKKGENEEKSDPTIIDETDSDVPTQVTQCQKQTQKSIVDKESDQRQGDDDVAKQAEDHNISPTIIELSHENGDKSDLAVNNWDSEVDYDQSTQMVPINTDKPDGIGNDSNDNDASSSRANDINTKLIGLTGFEPEKTVHEKEQQNVVPANNDGDISASETEGAARSKPKKKLKEKDRKSLLRLISEYYMKRRERLQSEKDNRNDSGSSGDDAKADHKKQVKKSPRKKREERKLKEKLNKDRQASTSSTKKTEKKKRTPNKKRTKGPKKTLNFVDDTVINDNSTSSTDFGKDNIEIQEDSSNGSVNILSNKEKRTDTAIKKTIDEKLQADGPNNSSIEDTIIDSTDNEQDFDLLNHTSEHEGKKNDEPAFLNQKKDAQNSNDSPDDELDSTQVADIRTLKWFSAETKDRSIQNLIRGNALDDRQNVQSGATNSDEDTVEESQVVRPFKKKSVPPLPSSQSEHSGQEMGSSLGDSDSTLVVSPFKRKAVLPLPATQSDVDNQSTDIQESSQVVSPFKRTTVLPLPSSESDVEDTEPAEYTLEPLRKGVKRPHSSEDSDSELPKDNDEEVADFDAETQVAPRLSKSSKNDLETTQPCKKRRKSTEVVSSNDRDISSHESDIEFIEEVPVQLAPIRFKLDDDGRDDLLEMLDQYSKENPTSASDGVADLDNSAAETDFNSDAETVALEPASQFKLGDSDRDNLLNLLTDKEQEEQTTEVESEMERQVEDYNSQFNLGNKERDDLLDLLNGMDKDSDSADGDSSDTGTLRDFDDSDDTDQLTKDDGKANKKDKDNCSAKKDKEGNKTSKKKSEQFKLDEDERDELLDILSQHMEEGEDDSSDIDKSSSSSDSDDDAIAGEKRRADDENKERVKRRKKKGVNREVLLELVEEFEEAASNSKDLNTSDNAHVKIRNSGNKKMLNMGTDFDNDLERNSYFTLDEDSDPESILMDVLREEPIELPENKKRGPGRPKDNSKEAWNAYQSLLKDDDDISDTSTDVSSMDVDDLEIDFSDQERRRVNEEKTAEFKKQFGIRKELFINVEEADISGFDVSPVKTRSGRLKGDDRLCDLSSILKKRKPSTSERRRLKKKRSSSTSSDSSSSSSTGHKLAQESDCSSSSCSDVDNNSLVANQDSFKDQNSPFRTLSDDEERERLANALWDNIRNSSDEQSDWSSSEGDSSDEREKRKKLDVSSKKKLVKKMESDDGSSSGDSSSSKSNEDNDSGDKEEESRSNKEADLDSSDEEDFVGVRKGRGAWRHDPLLRSCLSTESDSDSDQPGTSKKRVRKRKEKKPKKESLEDSDSDIISVSSEQTKTPVKKSSKLGDSDDSDFEIVEKEKTPQKPIPVSDEEDTPSKRAKGRRNLRALVEGDDLSEATQRANNEEKDRMKRLQERDKAKETFTQSQSFCSQLSEEDVNPLVLDVYNDVQIKVHPKITQKLKPHQRDGIQFMWDSCYLSVEQLDEGWGGSGCILAHCMGLGKTLQALALIQTLFSHQVTKTKNVLVVCPLSTVSNWRNEYNLAYKGIKHTHVKLYTIEDKKAAVRRFDIVNKWRKTGGMLVLGYECFGLLTDDKKLIKSEDQALCQKEDILEALVDPGPDLIICDEGHLLRNKQSQRTLALNKVKTKRRIILTGTPLQNNLLEYYCMVHFVKPNLLGTEKEYKTNFNNPIINGQFEDSTAEDIMFMKKRTHVLHKILKDTVQRVEDTELKQYLPKLVDQAVFVKLSDLQVNLYNKFLDSATSRPVVFTKAGNVSHKSFLADVQMLRYICLHPDVVTTAEKNSKSKIKEQDIIDDNMDDDVEEKVFSRGDWYKGMLCPGGTKKLELGSKLMVALSIVEEATANGDKVLIFAQAYAEMDNLESFLVQRLKYKKNHDYYRMDGMISPEVRSHMCDKFNKKDNKTLKVFIMSTKVGGLGLNLTAANRVIIMNVNWNPSYDTQSVFRVFRFGQTKAVFVYRLIALDTMEEKMYQRVVTKLAIAHRVVDKHQITRHYSAADIQEFYSIRPSIEKDRPVPNVPEDRVLAKLVQKHQYLYRWHEHQALLANRPEEDLDEQQKNAAWEEYNKKSEDPPPLPPPVIQQPPLPVVQKYPPYFLNASVALPQPGPSGMQNKINIPVNHYPAAVGRQTSSPPQRQSRRIQNLPPPSLYPNYPRRLPQPATPPPMNHVSLVLKQTPSGPQLVFQSGTSLRHIPIRMASYAPSSTVLPAKGKAKPAGQTRTTGRTLLERAHTIRDINTLIEAQTTTELIPALSPASGSPSASSTGTTVDQNSVANGIDELNSIINESLSQPDDFSSDDWANDGMNVTLASVDLPDSSSSQNIS